MQQPICSGSKEGTRGKKRVRSQQEDKSGMRVLGPGASTELLIA